MDGAASKRPSCRLSRSWRLKGTFRPATTKEQLLKLIVTDLHEQSSFRHQLEQWHRQKLIERIVRGWHRKITRRRYWHRKKVRRRARTP